MRQILKDYQKKVFLPWWLSVRSKGKIDLGQKVMAWFVVCPPRAGSDVDNFSKCFFDCLEAAGGVENDNLIVSHHIEKGPRISGGLLRVFLANERHREQLTSDYFAEFSAHWLPLRDGGILKQPPGLRHRRAAFVETPRQAESQS